MVLRAKERSEIMANQNKDPKKGAPLNQDDTAQNVPAPKGVFNIAKDTVSEFLEDNCLVFAGAIAYTAVQSVIPLLLGFLAVGSLFLQDAKTKSDFVSGLKSSIPPEIANAIDLGKIIDGFVANAGATSIISVLLFLWTGSGMFGQIKFCVNIAYDVEKDKRNPILGIALQLFMLVVLGGLLIVAVVFTFVIGLVLNFQLFGLSLGGFSFLASIIGYIVPFAIESLVFAIIYKISPAREGVLWKPVLIAGLFAGFLFEVLKVFMGIYVNVFGAASGATKTYGAIGGIFVFLFFLYMTGVVILLGAELGAVLQNFKSGMAEVETKQGVVETKAAKVGNEYVPQNMAGGNKQPAMAPSFNYGTVEQDPAVMAAQEQFKNRPSYVTTSTSITPVRPNPVTTFIGGAVLVIAAAISFLTRRKSQA